ncbi:MAG: GHKL domain-containing protein [Candidatus Eremiobacteraeota bacterium]|nr:GHKL domain-containing protein [Candidatus Eremiobacteraeota bacterium]
MMAGLWLGAVILQAAAAEWPGLNLFSSAPALSMTAALLGGAAAVLAPWICLSSLFLRSLVGRSRRFFWVLQINLADAVPELLAVCAISRGAPVVGCLLYAPLAAAWSRWVLGRKGGWQMLMPYTAVAGAALLGGGLELAAFPWRLAPLLVVLAVLQQRQVSTPRAGWRRPLGKSSAQLALESLPATLAACRTQASVLDAVLQVLATVCPSRSRVIFLLQEGRLMPARYHSPLQERLAAYALLNQVEPVVEQAWLSQAVLPFPPLPGGARFFQGEPAGAALWIEQEGVLYVGREKGLREDELRALEWIAPRAGAALRVARSQENERLALEQYRREHERLEEELQRLQSLLDGTRQMASTLDLNTLGERLEGMLRASIAHDFGAIFTLDQGQLYLRRQWGAPILMPAALAVCQAVLSHQIPFLLEPGSRLEPLVPAQRGLVAAPMQLEQGTTGVLLVGTTRNQVYEREHQDLLWLIGCLAAISFSNASLHQEVLSTQDQLLHAGKLAAIGQLAAGVAHELNTPLGAIQLCLDGLSRQLRDAQTPSTQKKLERGKLATDQAREIVEKLLVYSRREDRATYEPVDLSLVVSQALELVQAQLKKDGVRVQVELGALPPVLAAPLELRQVLTNLLLNARDAALSPQSRSREITLRARFQDGWAWMQVLDHGPGVDPEIEKRIFEPFFTTKEVGRGTGLGLSISHRIAVKHGGSLEYQTLPEGGACFSLRLPVSAETK